MSAARLWDRARLRPGDLPTLQETLDACDRQLLERVILEEFACRGTCVDAKRLKRMRRRLDASLDAMSALRVERGPNKGWVLAPRESYVLDARQASIAWRLCAALVPRYDVAAAKRLLDASGGQAVSYKQVKAADRRLRSLTAGGQGSLEEDAFGERSYALSPWERTLGCKVWLGGDWRTRERYLVLASAFWEMTFFGFEYDKIQARMAREKAARLMGSSFDVGGKPLRFASAHRSGALAVDYGLSVPDRFSDDALKSLSQRVAVMNHNARHAFYERMLDLARRLERS